jgi:hypothetical protein
LPQVVPQPGNIGSPQLGHGISTGAEASAGSSSGTGSKAPLGGRERAPTPPDADPAARGRAGRRGPLAPARGAARGAVPASGSGDPLGRFLNLSNTILDETS